MSLKLTTNVTNALAVTGSLRSLFNGGFLYCYTGPVPTTADEAVNGASVMAIKITEGNDGTTGLTFEATATNGVLRKTLAETWAGSNATGASRTLTFFRFCVGSDDGSGVAGGSDYRAQGTIGTDMTFDMWLTSVVYAAADTLSLDDGQFNVPQERLMGCFWTDLVNCSEDCINADVFIPASILRMTTAPGQFAVAQFFRSPAGRSCVPGVSIHLDDLWGSLEAAPVEWAVVRSGVVQVSMGGYFAGCEISADGNTGSEAVNRYCCSLFSPAPVVNTISTDVALSALTSGDLADAPFNPPDLTDTLAKFKADVLALGFYDPSSPTIPCPGLGTFIVDTNLATGLVWQIAFSTCF